MPINCYLFKLYKLKSITYSNKARIEAYLPAGILLKFGVKTILSFKINQKINFAYTN